MKNILKEGTVSLPCGRSLLVHHPSYKSRVNMKIEMRTAYRGRVSGAIFVRGRKIYEIISHTLLFSREPLTLFIPVTRILPVWLPHVDESVSRSHGIGLRSHRAPCEKFGLSNQERGKVQIMHGKEDQHISHLCVRRCCVGRFIQRHHSPHYDTFLLLHPASPYVASSLGVSHTS